MFITKHVRAFSSLQKTVLISTQRTFQNHGTCNITRLLPAISTLHVPKTIHTKSVQYDAIENMRPNIGLVERMLRKAGLNMPKYRNMALAYFTYEHVMKQVDYPHFFKYFNMTDTFFSWFLVTELHVWMIMVRYMAEGDTGLFIRNNVVNAMWEDTNARIEKLGSLTQKLKNKELQELSAQFDAAIIGYDEGIHSEDKVLAGALWRRFFHSKSNNPEHIEILLIYIRKQICLFDNLPTHEILRKPILKLIDIKDLCKHK